MGEAQKAETEAVESHQAVHATESPASTNRLMEKKTLINNLDNKKIDKSLKR